MEPSPEIAKVLSELRIALEGTAKNFLHKVYGPAGPPWGTRFADLEEVATRLGDEVARQFINQGLNQQATTNPTSAFQTCSQCGNPVLPGKTEPRVVQTQVGDAAWSEPKGYCGKCRKAFFPSVQESGH